MEGWFNGSNLARDGSPIGSTIARSASRQIGSRFDLVSHDSKIYASIFEVLNRSLDTLITKLSKLTEESEETDTQETEVVKRSGSWLH